MKTLDAIKEAKREYHRNRYRKNREAEKIRQDRWWLKKALEMGLLDPGEGSAHDEPETSGIHDHGHDCER